MPAEALNLTEADWLAIEREACRRSFWEYRRSIHPELTDGWWQQDIACHIERFYSRLVNGERPKLVIQAPPQHGKTVQIVDAVSWMAGMNPDIRTIYTSFSERLGVRANLSLQRIYTSPAYRRIFPDTNINESNVVTVSGQFLRNREILEYVKRAGYFRNTTVLGPITGEGLDLGIVDDPIKGRAEASSKAIRDRTWDWITDDFLSRFSEYAGMLCIMTRWHVDDPVGRMIENFSDVEVLRYPAIAEHDEENRKKGDPLFPELKSREFLLERKSAMTSARWQALYQQNPIIEGGGMFKVEGFKIVDAPPKLKKKVRYWDKAGTEGGGAFSAGVLMGETVDGQSIVLDVVRGQWSSMNREKRIKQCAEMDDCDTWIEQEPGSGGKESAEATIRNLRGHNIKAERVTGDKIYRAEPYSAQVEAGNVLILKADWNREFIDEHEHFPDGKYKDQVDAGAGAFNKLHGKKRKSGVW